MIKTAGFSLQTFSRDARGNVAMIFALAAIGIVGIAGLAVDYSRQKSSNAVLQAAADHIALALAVPAQSQPADVIQTRAEELFAASIAGKHIKNARVEAKRISGEPERLYVAAAGEVESSFGGLFRINALPIVSEAEAPLVMQDIEVALVVDNSGSMNGAKKLHEVKKAARSMLKALRERAKRDGAKIRVSVVPFAKEINIGVTHANQSWIDWSSYTGQQANWKGCVSDRTNGHGETEGGLPGGATRWHPTHACMKQNILPLTEDFAAVDTEIGAMKGAGYTNINIGLAWGANMLTPGAPASTAAAPKQYLRRYMVFVTDDGENPGRSANPHQFDSRTRRICDYAKASEIKVFTISVLRKNQTELDFCASQPSMAYRVKQPVELSGVMEDIARRMVSIIYLSM